MRARPGRNWNDATTLVIQGKAGMQIMGDWAKGEFVAAGQTAGKEYGCTVLSNKGTGYVMGGDVFVFPKLKDAAQVEGAARARQGHARARDADRVHAEEGLDPGPPRRRCEQAGRLRAEGDEVARRQEPAGAARRRCCRRRR